MISIKRKNFITFLIFVIICGLAIYFFTFVQSDKKISFFSQESKHQTANSDFNNQQPEGEIIFTAKGGTYTDIYLYNLSSQQSKKIFTDRDEKEKIKSVANLTEKEKILIAMAPEGEEFISSLYLLKTDGSGQYEKINDQFTSTQPPIISPNEKYIAYTLFNNAERDFGFKLIISDLDGSNKRQLFSDSETIKIHSFDPQAKKICFSQNKNSKTFLQTIDIESLEQNKLEELDQQIVNLSWEKSDQMLMALKPSRENYQNTNIYSLDLEKSKLSQLTNKTNLNEYAHFSPDDLFLIYLSKDSTDNANYIVEQGKGEILSISNEKKTTTKIDNAFQIIDWRKSAQ